MELRKVEKKEGSVRIVFEHSLREDFVNRALEVFTDARGTITKLVANSARYGVAVFEAPAGLVRCNRWEGEAASGPEKHYQTSLMGEPAGPEHAELILDDCLAALYDFGLKTNLSKFARLPGETFVYHPPEPGTAASGNPYRSPGDAETQDRKKLRIDPATGELMLD